MLKFGYYHGSQFLINSSTPVKVYKKYSFGSATVSYTISQTAAKKWNYNVRVAPNTYTLPASSANYTISDKTIIINFKGNIIKIVIPGSTTKVSYYEPPPAPAFMIQGASA